MLDVYRYTNSQWYLQPSVYDFSRVNWTNVGGLNFLFHSWYPCHRGEVGRGFPFLPLSFVTVVSLRSLSAPCISFCCSPFLPTLSMPLLMQSSHRNLGLPLLLFPSLFWASALFAIFFHLPYFPLDQPMSTFCSYQLS